MLVKLDDQILIIVFAVALALLDMQWRPIFNYDSHSGMVHSKKAKSLRQPNLGAQDLHLLINWPCALLHGDDLLIVQLGQLRLLQVVVPPVLPRFAIVALVPVFSFTVLAWQVITVTDHFVAVA